MSFINRFRVLIVVGTVGLMAALAVSAPPGALAAPLPALHWGKSAAIDPGHDMVGVSCSSTTFCMAVDSKGYALAHTRGKWQPRKRVDTHGHLTAISCASYTFCAAVDDQGYAFVYQSGKWSTAVHAYGHALSHVSCPTHLSCVAVGAQGREVGWNGTRWQTPGRLSSSLTLNGVSCPSAAVCYVIAYQTGSDARGTVIRRSSPGHWDTGQVLSADTLLEAIDCPSPTSCVTTASGEDDIDYTARYLSGRKWGPAKTFPTDIEDALPVLSCATATYCVTALGGDDLLAIQMFSSTGQSTSSNPAGLHDLGETNQISCATASNCVLVADFGVVRGVR